MKHAAVSGSQRFRFGNAFDCVVMHCATAYHKRLVTLTSCWNSKEYAAMVLPDANSRIRPVTSINTARVAPTSRSDAGLHDLRNDVYTHRVLRWLPVILRAAQHLHLLHLSIPLSRHTCSGLVKGKSRALFLIAKMVVDFGPDIL